jgi:tetratricopeptide (TPR) repeat protein
MKNIKASAYLAATLLIISCNAATAANLKESPIETIQTVSLSHEDLIKYMLIADMALQRNMPDVALQNYMLVAKYTRDPEVAQLATEVAVQLQNTTQALAAADIWATAAPKDIQAQLVGVTLFVNSDRNKTVTFLTNAFQTGTPDLDQHLLTILSKLPPAGQKNLTEAVFQVADKQPKSAQVQLAAAQLAAVQLDIPAATKKIKLALTIQPDLTSAIELNAKLIRHQHNDDKPALTYLEQQLKKYPKNGELRMFYITALIDNNQFDKAMPNLQQLSKDPTFGGEALLNLGEIYITKHNYVLAESTIKKALAFDTAADKANYYLAQLAEYNNDNPQAIKYYELVSESSEFHIPSFLRAAYLYSIIGNYDQALATLQNSSPSTFLDQKQVLLTEVDILVESQDLEQALEGCNSALAVVPDDVDFLYARSIVNSLLKKSTESEKDLRTILQIEPNNANALNALGFTLANQASRLNEAMPLLQKAISLNPDNPAFMDSMGWLLYKMGKFKESIDMLSKAYKLSNDSEIAAHFGEVLWASGDKTGAKDIWNKALTATPLDKQAIQETLSRLNIPMSEVQTTSATGSVATTPAAAKARN